MSSVTVSSSPTPIEGLLNLYGPDGYTFLPRSSTSSQVTIETACMNPATVYNPYGKAWYTPETQYWGSGTNKTFHDPCPQGWRVPEGKNYYHLFQSGSSGSMRSKNAAANYVNNGGVLAYCDTNSSVTTYFRLTGYQEKADAFNYIGLQGNVWCREHTNGLNCLMLCINPGGYSKHRGYDVSSGWYSTDAQNLRCIQEQK